MAGLVNKEISTFGGNLGSKSHSNLQSSLIEQALRTHSLKELPEAGERYCDDHEMFK